MNKTNQSNLKSCKKNKKNQSPELVFQLNLNSCSKDKDLHSAITLYDAALSQTLNLNQNHFNTLLYICSNSIADPSLKEFSLQHGFRIYDDMVGRKIPQNEATITSVSRLAAAKGDGDYAFRLVKDMKERGAMPRLRTLDPALYCFCGNLEADKAYEVEEYMESVGVVPEEDEIRALLKVSAETGREDRVYRYLHRLRNCVGCVSEETKGVIEGWFCGDRASEVVGVECDAGRVKEVVVRNGGGFYGLGWFGKGKWAVRCGNVEVDGVCCCCGERLACVDIDDDETERFANSLAALAMEREVKANFREFQDWLDKHNEYKSIVDGANVGLYQQNFADGGFSVSQLDAVVSELYNKDGNKWPLVVMHNKRFRGLLENQSHRKLLQEWIDKGVLYATPTGSNDDWYWLYAAVKLKCLLVTNDEMRDHVFELLGSSFFLKWKERHQVRYTFLKGSLKLLMPPAFSSVIQESEKGSWHVPVRNNNNEECVGTWLCITRSGLAESSNGAPESKKSSYSGHDLFVDDTTIASSELETVMSDSCSQGCSDLSYQLNGNQDSALGKRKQRSISPSKEHCPSNQFTKYN